MLTINNKIGFMNFRSYSKALRMPRVFPANAGMNRTTMNSPLRARSVPRKRGDEPRSMETSKQIYQCSPQTRG